MFYRTLEGLLLKCLGLTEVNRLLHEVHEGACGTHQSAHKMKWLIRRSDINGPPCLKIASNIIRDVRHVRGLERYRWYQRQ
jgi:hypothetical protein